MQRLQVLACAAALALAACGDPVSTGDPLTAEEASFLAEEIAGPSFDTMGGTTQPQAAGPAGASTAQPPFAFNFNASDSCDGGGTVTVSGTIGGNIDDAGTGTLAIDITEVFTNCRVTRNTQEFIVSSDPNIELSGDFRFENGAPVGNQQFGFEGAFTWQSGERSGGCQVEFSATFNPTTESGTVSGKVCGHEVSVSVT